VRARVYPTEIAAGAEVVKGPYVAEKVPVTVEEHYVVVEF
jgi:3-phenylpropionate/trans-cinnamate dioxygenase ferredoxin subunit